MLQNIDRRLKFVPQFLILVAGYVTFISYCKKSNGLFLNSVCTKVMMKKVQIQSSSRLKVMYVMYMSLTTVKSKGPLVIGWVIWVGMQCLLTVMSCSYVLRQLESWGYGWICTLQYCITLVVFFSCPVQSFKCYNWLMWLINNLFRPLFWFLQYIALL